MLWIPFHADWSKARESKTRKRGKGERKKGRKKSKKKGKWIANGKTMPQLKWGSGMEKSPDNVRQEQGQDGKKKENTAQYIISCDLIYQELVLCVLILCHPKGVSWACVPGRRAGCHSAADRCFILSFNFRAALRLCEHGYLTAQVWPAFSCLSPKHRKTKKMRDFLWAVHTNI